MSVCCSTLCFYFSVKFRNGFQRKFFSWFRTYLFPSGMNCWKKNPGFLFLCKFWSVGFRGKLLYSSYYWLFSGYPPCQIITFLAASLVFVKNWLISLILSFRLAAARCTQTWATPRAPPPRPWYWACSTQSSHSMKELRWDSQLRTAAASADQTAHATPAIASEFGVQLHDSWWKQRYYILALLIISKLCMYLLCLCLLLCLLWCFVWRL